MEIFTSNQLVLTERNKNIYISVLIPGMDVKSCNEILMKFPRIKITSFKELKSTLDQAAGQPVMVGAYKEKIEVAVSDDEMTAYVKLNMTEDEIKTNSATLPTEVLQWLYNRGVSTGIKSELIAKNLHSNKKIIAAKGIDPIDGANAVVKYFPFADKRPKIVTEGKVDHYELNHEVPAKVGRDFNFKYDKETVEMIEENGVQTLIAKQDGVVKMQGGKICVDNHLVVNGNVDYSTGNIIFDGYVTVIGSVMDNFSVQATLDISIEGAMGVGAAKSIESVKGSIVIKGGVNGKNRVVIKAAKNVYVKYAKEANIQAEEIAHIGLYAYDCIIEASQIILVPQRGRIIGGTTNAIHKIETNSIGNIAERKTQVSVEGFDRSELVAEIDVFQLQLDGVISDARKLKRKLEIFECNMDSLDERALNAYKGMYFQYENFVDEISRLQHLIVDKKKLLKTRGDGEIKVHGTIYPKAILEIKSQKKKVDNVIECSLYVSNDELHMTN